MSDCRYAIALLFAVPIGACATVDNGDSARSEIGPEWLVEDISGRGVIDDARTTIVFGSDGDVSGDTSCNRFFAKYTLNQNGISFQNPGVTKRACPPAVMDQENRFLEVFNAVDRYRIDTDTGTLVLSTPAGAAITARNSEGGG